MSESPIANNSQNNKCVRLIDKPIIVIVGPTASGKTELAIKLAERFGGEIICADSRTVYKGLDIGTAKPTKSEQDRVKHWGIDLVSPNEKYSAAQFQIYAKNKIDQIISRGKVPIVVGGTGLYISSLIYNYSFVDVDQKMKIKLNNRTVDELKEYCRINNIDLPKNHKNKLHLVNNILRKGKPMSRKSNPGSRFVVVGISTERDALRSRIRRRAICMFKNNIVKESTKMANLYGWNIPGMTGNVYPIVRQLVEGEIAEDQAIEKAQSIDWQLARRQMTWFRRDKNIKWLSLDETEQYICDILTNSAKM